MILQLTVPLGSLLFVMRDSLVFLTLQWGAMNTSAANDNSGLFGILLVCAPAGALSLLLQKVAFSRGDMKSPAVTQVILALLIALFVPYAGTVASAKGAVWAHTFALWMCTVLLIVIQAWWYRAVQFLSLVRYSCLIVLIALGTAAISVATREAISVLLVQSKPTAILSLSLAASMSVAFSYLLAKHIGVREVSELSGYVRWQWERLSLSRTVRKRDYQWA